MVAMCVCSVNYRITMCRCHDLVYMDRRLAVLGSLLLLVSMVGGAAAGGVPATVGLNLFESGADPANGNQGPSDVRAISFVALCTDDSAALQSATVTATEFKTDEKTDPTTAAFESDPSVDYVVYKAGPDSFVLSYDPAASSGTVTAGEGDPAGSVDPSISPPNPCGEGNELAKFEWNGQAFVREEE